MNAYYHQYKIYNSTCYFYILRKIIFHERKVTASILLLVTVVNHVFNDTEELTLV